LFIFVFLRVHPALAHGSEPRLEINVERINPGGVVDVRGVDFEPEELATLALTGPSSEISLGEVTADTEGIFLQIIALPSDLPEGIYMFRAVTDDHEISSPELMVAGAPILNEEGEGQREEEDLLLAPMPTTSTQQQIPVSGPTQDDASLDAGSVPAETISPNPATDSSPYTILVAAIIAIIITLIVGERILRRR
jgi:hypothetical protein